MFLFHAKGTITGGQTLLGHEIAVGRTFPMPESLFSSKRSDDSHDNLTFGHLRITLIGTGTLTAILAARNMTPAPFPTARL